MQLSKDEKKTKWLGRASWIVLAVGWGLPPVFFPAAESAMEEFDARWQFVAATAAVPIYYLLVCSTSFVLAVTARRRSAKLHEGKYQGGATVGWVLSLAFGTIATVGAVAAAFAIRSMLADA